MPNLSQKLLKTVIIKISQKINNLENLNRTDKEVLSQIQFYDNSKHCHATNNRLADDLGICVRQIQRIIKKLELLGYLVRELWDGCTRIIKTITKEIGKKEPAPKPQKTNVGGDDIMSPNVYTQRYYYYQQQKTYRESLKNQKPNYRSVGEKYEEVWTDTNLQRFELPKRSLSEFGQKVLDRFCKKPQII